MKSSPCFFASLVAICLIPRVGRAEPVKLEIKGDGFVADAYHTEGSPKKLGVLVLGGAEGGKQEQLAWPLVNAGYPVLNVAYFKVPGTPSYLDMIPLEYFDKPIEWMQHNERMSRGLVIVGASKGAELALLLASKKPEIKGVIAMAPSSVVWQGIPEVFWPPRSSWSLDGDPVPFVPYDLSKGWTDLLVLYRQSLTNKEEVAKASIEVEKISGPVLLLSGDDDKLWPSQEMAEAVVRRLKEKGFKYEYEHANYPDAGHTLTEHYMIGGTEEGNRQARVDSMKRVMAFLERIENGSSPPGDDANDKSERAAGAVPIRAQDR